MHHYLATISMPILQRLDAYPTKEPQEKNVCTICSKEHLCLEQSILIEHMTSDQTRLFRRQLQEV